MSQASLYTILNNVTTKTYVTGITIYNTQQCNHQNLCHRHHYIQYSTNVTTKTYVTGITIYILNNVTTKTYVTGITIYNTQQCNHQNLCHRHHYIHTLTRFIVTTKTYVTGITIYNTLT